MAKIVRAAENRGGFREGAGRPQQGKSPTKKIMLTMPEHLLKELDKAAYKIPGGSRSGFIAECLAKALKVKL
jgi:hypothetical protein